MRGAPLAAAVVFLGAALAWLWRDPVLRHKAYPRGSSLSTGPDGASLARGYLEKRGTTVTTLARPLLGAALPREAVLFRIEPEADRDRRRPSFEQAVHPEAPDGGTLGSTDGGTLGTTDGGALVIADGGALGTPDGGALVTRDGVAAALTDAEDAFVRAGGRLVLAIPGEPATGAAHKVLPLLPGVRELRPLEPRTLAPEALVDAQPVFERGGAPSLARRALGEGEVWLLAEPELLLNRSLGEADHLKLLLALAGAGRPVVLDELVHGLRDEAGVLDLLRRWGLGPALLAGALVLCAAFWRGAVTLGPAADPYRDPRSDAVELIDSMAALYRRALSPAQALHLYRERLVHEIALRKGLSERRAEALLPQYAAGLDLPPQAGRISDAQFRSHLAILVRAFERLRDEHRRRRS
jgi:hypothetical protein